MDPLARLEAVAALARLELEASEKARLAGQFEGILRHFESIREVPLEGVAPLAHVAGIADVFREDEERPSLPRDRLLSNAPDPRGEFFGVPPVLEG
jgi:aspartyl-tRNA(Asn)/glutamyl-tRNA(Gln) amidotransferase subunit C